MVERVIYALFYIGSLMLGYYLIVWFLGAVGLVLPAMVLHIIMAMLVLLAVLVLWRIFGGANIRWWPDNPPRP